MVTIPSEVGSKYDCGFSSPTWGDQGFVIKPGTYQRQQQLIKRTDVTGALQTAIADRDINFWTRLTQADWSYGSGQKIFGNSTVQLGSFDYSQGIDNHVPGQISIVPQPAVLTSTVASQVYRGACLVQSAVGGTANAFFAWTTGNYLYSTDIVNAVPTFTSKTTGGAGAVLDIETDGTNVWFATTGGGVWTTTAAAPGNLTQYDTGANVYHRLKYDPLKKILYAILAPSAGAALHKVNSGGGPTTIYNFVSGRLDAIEYIFGDIFVAWNAGDVLNSSPSRSFIYYYDGTNVFEYTNMGDGAQIVGLKNSYGQLWAAVINEDVFNDAGDNVAGASLELFQITSTITNRGTLTDAQIKQESTTKSPLTSGQFALATGGTPKSPGGSLFFGSSGLVWRYDYTAGQIVSKSFGSTQISVGGTTYNQIVVGLLAVQGKMVALVELLATAGGAQSGGAVVQLSGAVNAMTALATGDCQLVSSRQDLGLPYVQKYWHSFEVIFQALIAGQSILMEYSLDDGVTWTSCTNFANGTTNPFSTLGGTKYVALIKQVNAHVRYRVTPAAPGTNQSPTSPAAKIFLVWIFLLTKMF